MRIYGIAVSEELLAGADLTGFLGFFDERYRVHDYDRGRMVARMVLTDPVMSEAGELGSDTVYADAYESYRQHPERVATGATVH